MTTEQPTTARIPRRLQRERRREDRQLRKQLQRWARRTRFYYAPDRRDVRAPKELRDAGYAEHWVGIGPIRRWEAEWFNELVDDAIRETADAESDIRLETAQEYIYRAVSVEREKRSFATLDRSQRVTKYLSSKEAAA